MIVFLLQSKYIKQNWDGTSHLMTEYEMNRNVWDSKRWLYLFSLMINVLLEVLGILGTLNCELTTIASECFPKDGADAAFS